jgi:deoxyribodipyrimidine photo-lyase
MPAGPGRSTVIWFRRDLRTGDHPALLAAVEEASALGRPVVPLFVADDALLAGSGVNRRAFLAGSLAALAPRVEGALTLRRGRPAEVVADFAAEVGADRVFATGDCTPYGRRRDSEVAARLEAAGGTLVLLGSPYAVAPGRVRTGGGRPYRVFTPFRRAWATTGWPPPADRPRGVRWRGAEPEVTPSDLVGPGEPAALPPAGEAAADQALEAFLDGPVDRYGDERDRPDHPGTSRLSPHLRFGTVHPRQVLARLGDSAGATTFRSELAWREFYADVLWHRPGSAWEPLQPVGRHLCWDRGPRAEERFAAWSAGRTGFPLVDAGMRQLRTEGWMHNRVRMLTASFLVKDLHIDWRRGARLFLDLLVDGDLASNNHGWQWVAGTGTDAAPFHRVFSPDRQAERFDPDRAYVRRYVPEVDSPAYPPPLVDHAEERAEALRRWQEASLALAREGAGERDVPGKVGPR